MNEYLKNIKNQITNKTTNSNNKLDWQNANHRKKLNIIAFEEWQQINPDNFIDKVIIRPHGDLGNIFIGKYTYAFQGLIVECHDSNALLEIGCFCSIATDVKFLLAGNTTHNKEAIMTYPISSMLSYKERKNITEKNNNIILEDDVWIGTGALIMSGVKIGKGAIIGARSVVTKNIPPYAIVAGNPATIKNYRFSRELIEKLLKIDFSKFDIDFIRDNLNQFYLPIEQDASFVDKLMELNL